MDIKTPITTTETLYTVSIPVVVDLYVSENTGNLS